MTKKHKFPTGGFLALFLCALIFQFPSRASAKKCFLVELNLEAYPRGQVVRQPEIWVPFFSLADPPDRLNCLLQSEGENVAVDVRLQNFLTARCEHCSEYVLITARPRALLKSDTNYTFRCDVSPGASRESKWAIRHMEGYWPTFTVGAIEAIVPPKIKVIDAEVSRIRCIWQRVATTIELKIPEIPPDFWAQGGYIKAIHEDGAVDILTPPRPEEEPDTFFAVRPGRGHDTIRLVAVNGAGEEGEETVLPVKWWWPKRKPLSKEERCDG